MHPYNCSLTVILGAAQLLKNTHLTALQRDYLNDIIRIAEGLKMDFNRTLLNIDKGRKAKRVLVVESMPMMQVLYKTTLSKLNYHVEITDNMKQALSRVENAYDLLILDLGFPDGNGEQIAKAYRAHTKHQNTVMIAISTFPSDEVTRKCLEAGMNEFYTKPVSPKKLAEIVKNIFRDEAKVSR